MEILTSDFTYDLPEGRIALFPTEQRDHSKLLIYQRGDITHRSFHDITEFLSPGSLLVFNNSKVIPARLRFTKASGAVVEIFLLNPINKNLTVHDQMNSSLPVQWICTIGNKKRWAKDLILRQVKNDVELTARLADDEHSIVEFGCNKEQTWSELLTLFGDTPLPPYIKRSTNLEDEARYQTVYSVLPGAVAAPTAGLHFTPEILNKIAKKGIFKDFLTLHVGAGTFQPIKVERATEHSMHEENITFTLQNIEQLLNHGEQIIAVGTTSCRSLESLYWHGVKLLSTPGEIHNRFTIEQHFAYQHQPVSIPTRKESLTKIYEVMKIKKIETLNGSTSIFIYPGYQFKMTDALITNFHQPNSTLLLLIAAFVGSDWKKIYESALQNGYRFLSYGDSSLLFPNR